MILDIRDQNLDTTQLVEAVRSALAEADESEVLSLSEELFLSTGGAFDPFGGPSPAKATFSPGGLVQAWSVGKAAEMLKAAGSEHYCVTSGGHIVMAGLQSPYKPWRVGIRNPVMARSLTTALVVGKGGLAVATSHPFDGPSEVIDASSTGQSELAGVTVVGPEITNSHAFAAALFVKGLEGLNWITQFKGYDAHIVTQRNSAHWTPGFKRHCVAQ